MNHGQNHLYEFGPFRLDPVRRLLWREAEVVSLKAKAFETLLVLVEHRGRVLEKDELMSLVWPDAVVEENTLNKNISALRRVLGETAGENRYIVTVPGRGYSFVAGVREVEDESDELVVETHTISRLVAKEEVVTEPSERPVVDLNELAAARTDSGIKPLLDLVARHKLGLSVAAATVVVALAVVGVGLWKLIGWQGANRPSAEIKLVPLTSFPGDETHVTFSPDGSQVAYCWDGGGSGNLDIYVQVIGAGTPLRLTTDPALDSDPAWSPDGRYLAFGRRAGNRVTLLLIPALGGPERKLVEYEVKSAEGALSILAPSWSPDGRFIAYTERPSPEDPTSIFLLSVETGEKRRLTWATVADGDPAISPDGKTLAFKRFNSSVVSDLYVVPIAGGEVRRLTFDNQAIAGLAWTPDGREIVFSSTRSNGLSLWRVRAAGGTPEQVAPAGGNAFYPALSRQGHRLAYTEVVLDTNIWRLELPTITGQPATARPAPMTKLVASTREENSPQYSPDGRRIAFVSNRAGTEEIWVCESDGSRPAQLTFFGAHTGTPRWSPDGRFIAFDSNAAGEADIYVIGVEARAPHRLTTDPTADNVPSWSRDGRWIYFCSRRSGSAQIWKVPAAGGEAVQVTKQGGFEAFESLDGKYLYYSKSYGPLGIWRMPVEGGQEEQLPELINAARRRYWAVGQAGIYFVPYEEHTPPTIKFFSFATGRVTPLAVVEKGPLAWLPGLAVSPDGRWLLYTQEDQRSSDIMLVENFR
jgi:Tol biopolymer transport system component/DNA-binding winged helix-turn-helix (wHTH) protein